MITAGWPLRGGRGKKKYQKNNKKKKEKKKEYVSTSQYLSLQYQPSSRYGMLVVIA